MEIKSIKKYLNIQTALQYYGLKLNEHDMLCCPFHEEQKPSLKVYPKTGTFNCFGCNATGDQIEFIEKKEGITKHEAILKAKEMLGYTVKPAVKTTDSKRDPPSTG